MCCAAYNQDHSDQSFEKEPASVTMLLPFIVPPSADGSNGTDLLDIKGTFDTLSQDKQREFEGLECLHGWSSSLLDEYMVQKTGDRLAPALSTDPAVLERINSSPGARQQWEDFSKRRVVHPHCANP
jgi:hypothetical protein